MADEDEEVSYEMLQELVRAERRSNKLMPVPTRFWPRVRDFLQAVTNDFRAAQQQDPWSRRAMLLSDEVKNAKHAAENLWALRERKFAMQALASERHKPEGITADEAQLYEALIEALDAHRRRVFEGTPSAPGKPLAPRPAPKPAAEDAGAPTPAGPASTTGQAGGSVPAGPEAPPPDAAQTPEQAPEQVPEQAASPEGQPQGDAPAPVRPAAEPVPPDLEAPRPVVVPADQEGHEPIVTVRALSDIPQFVGPDMQTYILKQGDLATLPEGIAQLLVRRKKAAVVEEA